MTSTRSLINYLTKQQRRPNYCKAKSEPYVSSLDRYSFRNLCCSNCKPLLKFAVHNDNNFRGHPRSIFGPHKTFLIRRLSRRSKLSLFRRLYRQRKTINLKHQLITGIQNKVSIKLFPLKRESWMLQY